MNVTNVFFSTLLAGFFFAATGCDAESGEEGEVDPHDQEIVGRDGQAPPSGPANLVAVLPKPLEGHKKCDSVASCRELYNFCIGVEGHFEAGPTSRDEAGNVTGYAGSCGWKDPNPFEDP